MAADTVQAVEFKAQIKPAHTPVVRLWPDGDSCVVYGTHGRVVSRIPAVIKAECIQQYNLLGVNVRFM